jgi:hypothetical protein
MNNTKENSKAKKGIDQTNCKMSYQTPELKEYGSISEIVQQFPGTGADGGTYFDCTRS